MVTLKIVPGTLVFAAWMLCAAAGEFQAKRAPPKGFLGWRVLDLGIVV